MICQSWERAKETERLGKWLKANYVRIEPLKVNLLRDKKIAIFKEGKPSRCCGLLEAVPSGVSQEQPVFVALFSALAVCYSCVCCELSAFCLHSCTRNTSRRAVPTAESCPPESLPTSTSKTKPSSAVCSTRLASNRSLKTAT